MKSEYEINETTRPDDTRPRPSCLEAEAEAIAIEAKTEPSFWASRPRPVRGLDIPGENNTTWQRK